MCFSCVSRNTLLPVQMCEAASHATEAWLVQLSQQSWAKGSRLNQDKQQAVLQVQLMTRGQKLQQQAGMQTLVPNMTTE